MHLAHEGEPSHGVPRGPEVNRSGLGERRPGQDDPVQVHDIGQGQDRGTDVPGGLLDQPQAPGVAGFRGSGDRGELGSDAVIGSGQGETTCQAGVGQARRTTVRGPARASRHPRDPHVHCGPPTSRIMCPISPALKDEPR